MQGQTVLIIVQTSTIYIPHSKCFKWKRRSPSPFTAKALYYWSLKGIALRKYLPLKAFGATLAACSNSDMHYPVAQTAPNWRGEVQILSEQRPYIIAVSKEVSSGNLQLGKVFPHFGDEYLACWVFQLLPGIRRFLYLLRVIDDRTWSGDLSLLRVDYITNDIINSICHNNDSDLRNLIPLTLTSMTHGWDGRDI